MISIRRVLQLEEFAKSNRLALLHGTFGRKFSYLMNCFVFPILCFALLLPLSTWMAIHTWLWPGDHAAEFGLWCGLLGLSVYYVIFPLLFRRRIRKMYQQQRLDRQWEIEISEAGIHTKQVGLADSRLEWAYFDFYLETEDQFLLLQKLRPVFLTIPKGSLDVIHTKALRDLLNAHLVQREYRVR
jgi:hypothetical protein